MVIQRCVTVFFKLAFLGGLMRLRENFTVMAPNCCCDDKHHKIRLKRKITGV